MYRIGRTNITYHYPKIGKVINYLEKTNTYVLLTGCRQLRYFKTERKFPVSINSTNRKLVNYVVYCDLDWGQKSYRVHIIGRLLDFKFIEHKSVDSFNLGLDVENNDFPDMAIVYVKENFYKDSQFYICYKKGWDIDEVNNEKILIEKSTLVKGCASELLFSIYAKPLSKFYIADAVQYKEAIVNTTNFIENLDVKEIAESAIVEYYQNSIGYIFSRDVGYVTEGEFGYKTIYKYLDCYLKTIFPFEAEEYIWADDISTGVMNEYSLEKVVLFKTKAHELNATIKDRVLLSLEKYDKDLHIAYLVREQVLKKSTFKDEEMETFKLICESSKKYWEGDFFNRIRYIIYNDQEKYMYWINTFNSIFCPILYEFLNWKHRCELYLKCK